MFRISLQERLLKDVMLAVAIALKDAESRNSESSRLTAQSGSTFRYSDPIPKKLSDPMLACRSPGGKLQINGGLARNGRQGTLGSCKILRKILLKQRLVESLFANI